MTRVFFMVFCIVWGFVTTAQTNPPLPSKPKKETTPTLPSTAPVKTTIKGKPNVKYINGIPAVTIGSQTWMQKNLDVDRFRNGDTIPHARTAEEWRRFAEDRKPAWCYYAYDGNGTDRNRNVYGKLYNWYAVTDRRGLAPNGWHVPDNSEWAMLITYLRKSEVNQLYPANQLRSTEYWERFWGNKNVTNSTGFTALPGGYLDAVGRRFFMDRYAGWWTTTEFRGDPKEAWFWFINLYDVGCYQQKSKKGDGYAVRCIRD